jgi:hypothetical protein
MRVLHHTAMRYISITAILRGRLLVFLHVFLSPDFDSCKYI